MRKEVPIVARYGEYAITHGATHGMYYVFERDTFVGMDKELDGAIDLIALREGMYFDPDKVEVMG